MTATTVSAPLPASRRLSPMRVALAVLVTAVFLVAMFVAGRVSAPTHTVQSTVTVPATASASMPACHFGFGRFC